MALTPGSRLGPYEILAPLGAGGMGEVYRATDTRLDREVAIKVLPLAMSEDAGALARFEREAKAVAALSHPNILAIHDVGRDGTISYAVMELLAGETLRQRLATSALSIRKAADIAREIALALAAAHEKGIVHRDLKPENVFLTQDGRVKVLDFGLARQIPLLSGDETNSPTLTRHTEPGTVLGTVGYMSPEQLRGHPADPRSDIFSFGAVLYEMLSGRRAFKGETGIETMNAILKEDPPELSESSRNISPGLERIVRHCLEKNPAERFQSARDLAFDLGALSDSTSSAALGPSRFRRRLVLSPWVAVTAALVLLLAGALAGWRLLHRPIQIGPVHFQRLTFRRGSVLNARFAPDGNTVVYSASWEGKPVETFTVRVDGTDTRPLGIPGSLVLDVSSKGEVVLILKKDFLFVDAGSGTLARVPLGGGTPREVLENVFEANWGPDGEQLAVVHRAPDGRRRLEYPIGTVLYESPNPPEWLRLSPGGDRIAFTEWDGAEGKNLVAIDRKGKKTVIVKSADSMAALAWSSRGDEIFFSGGPSAEPAVRAASLSGSQRILLPGSWALYDVASDGRLLVERYATRGGLVCLPRGETRERELSWLDSSVVTDISGDGHVVVFTETGEGSGPRLGTYVRKTDGTPAVRLGDGVPFCLSPDGKWVVTRQDGPPRSLVLLPTGAGSPKKIPVEGVEPLGGCFIRERPELFVWAPGQDHVNLYAVPPEGGKPRLIPTPEFDWDSGGGFSPSGDVFYRAKDGRLKKVPFQGGEPQSIPGAPLDRLDVMLQFTADGRSVYLARSGTIPLRIDRLELQTGKRELWKELIPADPTGVNSIRRVSISHDGQSYAYSYGRVLTSDLYIVRGAGTYE